MEEYIVRIREELDRERAERNYFQLERDKVNTFWEITKRQLEEKKANLRNVEREMEEAEERHQTEIKVYKQKVKHLLYEHNNNITEVKNQSKFESFIPMGLWSIDCTAKDSLENCLEKYSISLKIGSNFPLGFSLFGPV